MKARESVVLIGAPDSGKTNYLGRFWRALRKENARLRTTREPDDISYVMDALSHLLQGKFAPRTEKGTDGDRRECVVHVSWEEEGTTRDAELLVPDVSGELWEEAMETNEVPETWMARVRRSVGALLFVRVGSPLNRPSLDWVTARELQEVGGAPDSSERDVSQVPTDVQLCEFLRFLEFALGKDAGTDTPRVAVLVTAWDMVDEDRARKGPKAYLQHEFPLFASRLAYTSTLDVKAFGLSVVSGDLAEDEFRTRFLDGEIDEFGYVVTEPDAGSKNDDVTTPVRWVLDGQAGR